MENLFGLYPPAAPTAEERQLEQLQRAAAAAKLVRADAGREGLADAGVGHMCGLRICLKTKVCELLHLFGVASHTLSIIDEVSGPDNLVVFITAAREYEDESCVFTCSKRRRSARSSRRLRRNGTRTSRQPASQRWVRSALTIGPSTVGRLRKSAYNSSF